MTVVVLIQCPLGIVHIACDLHVSSDVHNITVHGAPSYTEGTTPYTTIYSIYNVVTLNNALTLSICSNLTDPAATLDPVYSSPVYKEL